ncbi:MAG: alpha/beta-hydrolase family protein [Corynebacterium sp.]|nr:alpha/beta-hydrolase family protein [Corynebacterium sp.]
MASRDIGRRTQEALFTQVKQRLPMPPSPTAFVAKGSKVASFLLRGTWFGVEVVGNITPGVRMVARRRLPHSFSVGIIGAEIATWMAVWPSLLPRPWWVTATNVGLAQATGHFIATSLAFGFRTVYRGARRSCVLNQELHSSSLTVPSLPWPIARNTGTVLHMFLGAMTGLAMLRAARDQKAQAQLVGTAQLRQRGRLTGAQGAALGVGLGTAGYGFSLLLGEVIQLVVDRLSRQYGRALPMLVAWPLAGFTFIGVLAVLSDRVLIRRGIARAIIRAQRVNRLIFPGSAMPWEPERSGSPWSLEPFTALGSQGRSFVSAGPRAKDISKLMGLEYAFEPIRIYVGLLPGRSTQAAVRRVLAEMDRTGAFRRESIIIHMPAGSGWLNNWSVSAPEFLTGGNCASISLQYSVVPSALSYVVDKSAPIAAASELIRALTQRMQLLPADDRPKLYLAGESLGAYAILDSFTSPADLLAACDGAVFTGAPRVTKFFSLLNRDSNSLERLPVITGGEHFRCALTPAHLLHDAFGAPYTSPWQRPRVVLGQHASDPIVWWSPAMAFRRPKWMHEPQPPHLYADTFPHLKWAPLISFWHVGIDQINSLAVPGGHGHNYHAELLWYWDAVLGSQSVMPLQPERAEQLTDWLSAHPAKLPVWP